MARFESETQYRGYKLRLDVSESSYSIENNTSTVSWSLYIVNGYKDGQYYRFNAYFSYSATINGSKRVDFAGNVDTTDVGQGQPHTLASGTYTIAHNNDGTKTISCSATCSGGGSFGPGNGSCSGNLTLTTIPRAATINSFSGTDIDNDFSIGYTKYVNDWTYYLRLSLSDNTQLDRVVYNTSGDIYRLPESAKDIIYNSVGNNDTVQIKAVIETYNGNTKIGESTALTNTCNINRNMWLNVSDTWKRGIPYVNINGVWKKGIPYININGVWKKAI